MNKVFVYGTLKTGGAIRGLDSFGTSTIVGKATTQYPDFDMADLGAFPAVTAGEKYISGEVWEVDDDTLEHLDAIEGYPNFYNRKQVDTTQGRAWMYYIADVRDFKRNKESSSITDHDDVLTWRN